MIDNIGTYLKEGNTYSSLEIFEREGQEHYSFLKVKRSKGELHVVHSENSDKPESLKQHLAKNGPVFLVLNTSKVLTKQIDTSDSSTPEAIVNHIFPNLSFDSFYYEITQDKTNPVVSISKMDYVNGMLEKLKDLGFSISKISLGVSTIVPILSHLEQDEITISNAELVLANGSIREIPQHKEANKEYLINGIKLSSRKLLPFGQILGHLKRRPSLTNFDDLNSSLVSNFGNKRIFDKVFKVAILFFLGLLLINFFVFDHYHSASKEQKSNLEISASQRATLKNLEQSVESKQERLEMLSTSSNSKSTYYLDLFAKNVPATILLEKIIYQPLKKPIRDSKPVELEKQNFIISGISENSTEFSDWIGKLERQSWTTSVETLDYDFLKGESSNFSLKIGIYAD